MVFDSCFSYENKQETGAFWERVETYASTRPGSDKEQLLVCVKLEQAQDTSSSLIRNWLLFHTA